MTEYLFFAFLYFGAGALGGTIIGYIIRSFRKKRMVTVPGPMISISMLFIAVAMIIFIFKLDNGSGLPLRNTTPQLWQLVLMTIGLVLFEVFVNHHTRIIGRWYHRKMTQ